SCYWRMHLRRTNRRKENNNDCWTISTDAPDCASSSDYTDFPGISLAMAQGLTMNTGLGVAPAKDKTLHFAGLILDLMEILVRQTHAEGKETPSNLEALEEVKIRLLLQYPENAKEIK